MATTFPTRNPSHSAHWWWATLAIVAVAALVLLAMGRAPICTCGTVKLWHGTVQSAENSQHLADWYSLSHIVHGLIFYGLGWLTLRRQPWQMRLALAALVEAAWEVLENSPIIIDRYRAVTIALGYEGDSVVNSLADIGWMLLGFAIARRLPPWATLALGIALEIVALVAIRDNLTLNVWMLVAPSDAVRSWQAGA
ncbi:DUF2585 domain-containing protein [Sphingomonas sp. PL-96]|uniref:DUF2585 family protein n=1 Tax=Sphingomonas sp. PL-96 TaxID=2887201 RepID=UPI001E59EAC5|nr:DUF2585 family protein [Sphingomonas sp. PL-96]MCC2977281.1 DUF2585 domain-containing protein [Sphingomonas sp. PL-96]